MGIRETLQRRKGLVTGIAILLIGAAVANIVYHIWRDGRNRNGEILEFFTIDDGRTFFTAGIDNVPPFTHEGKEAVKAVVYECDGKRFVAYMHRYTPEGHQVRCAAVERGKAAAAAAAKAKAEGKSPEAAARAILGSGAQGPGGMMESSISGSEFKRPGDKEWVRATDREKVMEIQKVTCPGGKGEPEPVVPGQ